MGQILQQAYEELEYEKSNNNMDSKNNLQTNMGQLHKTNKIERYTNKKLKRKKSTPTNRS